MGIIDDLISWFGSFLEGSNVRFRAAKFFDECVKIFTVPNATIDRGFNDFDNKAGG